MNKFSSRPKTANVKSISVSPIVYVNLSYTKYPVVHDVIHSFGWKTSSNNSKILLYWCDSEGSIDFSRSLYRWQFYNHFPGMWCIAHKCELTRLLIRMNQRLPALYNFLPISINLPAAPYDLGRFLNSFHYVPDRYFIIKPDTGSQGRGIIITSDLDEISVYPDPAVAQIYISPLLLGGLKFDLRIYVLVTSVDPLRLYLFREGMARFCTEPYSPPTSDISTSHQYRYSKQKSSKEPNKEFSQLTNFSLNKNNPNFQAPETGDLSQATTGHKRSLSAVFSQLADQGVNTQKLWQDIENIVRLTLLAAEPQLAAQYHIATNANDGRCRCFEILGFDILIDKNCKPWLLEVNCMPSLASTSPFDTTLKENVVRDALKIIDIQPDFKKKCTDRFLQRTMVLSTYISSSRLPRLFDPIRETEIAKTTNFSQLYPIIQKEPNNIVHNSNYFITNKNNKNDINPDLKSNERNIIMDSIYSEEEEVIMEHLCYLAHDEAKAIVEEAGYTFVG